MIKVCPFTTFQLIKVTLIMIVWLYLLVILFIIKILARIDIFKTFHLFLLHSKAVLCSKGERHPRTTLHKWVWDTKPLIKFDYVFDSSRYPQISISECYTKNENEKSDLTGLILCQNLVDLVWFRGSMSILFPWTPSWISVVASSRCCTSNTLYDWKGN